jgi:hypothetical protein
MQPRKRKLVLTIQEKTSINDCRYCDLEILCDNGNIDCNSEYIWRITDIVEVKDNE